MHSLLLSRYRLSSPPPDLCARSNVNVIANDRGTIFLEGIDADIDATIQCAIRTDSRMAAHDDAAIMNNAQTWSADVDGD